MRPSACWPPGSPPRATGRRRATARRPACSPPWRGSRPARPGAPWRPAGAWPPCPAIEEALRAGALSGPEGGPAHRRRRRRPRHARGPCWPGPSRGGRWRSTKERCLAVRATSARHDPVATARRIHAERHFSHWTDAEGAFCFSGRDSAERGAALLARLVPAANRLRDARRAAAAGGTPDAPPGRRPGATPPAAPDPGPSPRPPCGPTPCSPWSPGAPAPSPWAHVRFDRLRRSPVRPARPAPIRLRPARPGRSRCRPAGGRRPGGRPPPATVIVRVDRDALVRGRALPGELCELDGQGPIPVPLARALAVDSFLSAGLHRGRRHPGRRPPGPDHQRHPAHRPGLPGPVLRGAGLCHALRTGDRPRRPAGLRRGRPPSTTWPCCAPTTTG